MPHDASLPKGLPLLPESTDYKSLVVTATFTAEPVGDALHFWIRELGLPFNVLFAGYNQVFQELLDPESLIGKNRSGVNVVLIRLDDWLGERKSGATSPADSHATIDRNVRDFAAAMRGTASRGTASNLIFLCPPTPVHESDDSPLAAIAEMESKLCYELEGVTGVTVIPTTQLQSLYPVKNGYDAQSDETARIPYTPEFFAALGTAIARELDGLRRPPYKVVVLDCDNTLWRGVAADEGPQGVLLDAPGRAVQEFMHQQRVAGRLLCLCSKNEEADIVQVFTARPEFPLHWNDFAAHRINWRPKSENLAALAVELNLGQNSFIFVDDNPAECAEVRANCPDVLVLQLPEEGEDIQKFLRHVWPFDLRKITAEDRQRTAMYQHAHERAIFQKTALSFTEFLAGLNLVVDIRPTLPAEMQRVAQLTERTNQFNLTTIRLREGQVQALIAAGNEVWSVSVQDRFGDYGLVGSIIFRCDGVRLTVHTFLLSCRVLGRGVEHQILAKLGQTALKQGCTEVRLALVLTKKNTPAREFLEAVGGVPRMQTPDEWEWVLPAADMAAVAFKPLPAVPLRTSEPLSDKHLPPIAPSRRYLAPSLVTRIAQELCDAPHILQEILRAKRRPRPEFGAIFVAPRTPAEHSLAGIWEEVLGFDQIGIHDDFFDLGGDSIVGIQIISKAGGAGVIFTLRQQFQNPTIAALVAAIVPVSGDISDFAMGSTNRSPEATYPEAAADTSYPLSSMQQGMLFETLQAAESGVCFEQDVYIIRGALDELRFGLAWRRALSRHAILRTTFRWEGLSEPEQFVHREAPLALHYEDRSNLAEQQQSVLLQEYMLAERNRGFDLTQLPLMRLGLIRMAPDVHYLVWSYHHVLLDGWSLPKVLQDVLANYGGRSTDGAEVQPRPYRDFITWLSAQDHRQDEAFWRARLKGFTSPTPLTVDRRSAATTTLGEGAFRRVVRGVPKSTMDALNRLARSHRVTLNTLFQGAWALLLGRYAAVDEVIFGCNISGRSPSLAGVEDMVGLFINTLPLRVSTAAGTPLREWLQEVQARVLELQEHEYSSLPLVQKWSQVAPGRQLFESIFVFANYPRLRPLTGGSGGLALSHQYGLRHTKTGYPLTLVALPGDDEWLLEAIFNTGRFDEATIARMLGHYLRLLKGFGEAPEAVIDAVPLTDAAERSDLIFGFNQHSPFPVERTIPLDGGATMHGLFEAQVTRMPDAVAVTCDGRSATYGQLNAHANRLAHRLRELGVGPDVLVGICMERSNDLVACLLGILKAGGAYLPIDLAYPAERLAFMLEDAKSPVLLTQSELAERLPTTSARVIFIDELLRGEIKFGEDENPPPTAGPDDLCYVIYTSGTTGKPKGSQITHRNVARLFSATDHWYGFNERDVWTLFHSYAFDFSVWEIWGALLYGGRVVIVPFMVSRSPEAFYELLVAEKVTVLNQTPSAFRQLILAEELVGQKPLALRYVIFGGEALEMQSLRPWFERHGDVQPQLVNMYGITETTVHVTYRALRAADLTAGSVIGVPIPDLQVYILDPRHEPVPVGVPGEMYVGGAGLARGYLHRPDLTAERFIPDHLTEKLDGRLYKTGDLARFLPGRDVEYLGRIDHQVKIRGFRIELGEIESVLCRHAKVRESIVLARSESSGGKRLVAYVVAGLPTPTVSDLRELLKRKLPDYMVPAAFVFLEKLPLTTNGKVDRDALPEPEPERPELAAAYVAASNPLEVQLVAIWARVLRVERVGIYDNVFELGANSILLIQAYAQLKRIIDSRLRITDLFQYPTIHALLKHFRDLGTGETAADAGKMRAERQKRAFSQNRPRSS